jgi:hypothetical protein
MSKARKISKVLGTSDKLTATAFANVTDLAGVDVFADSDTFVAAVASGTVRQGRMAYFRNSGRIKQRRGSDWNEMTYEAPLADASYTIQSVTPNPVNEGVTVTAIIHTGNDDSTLYWTINGTTADFSAVSGSSNYSVAIPAGISKTTYVHTITFNTIADVLSEGNETFILSVRTDSVSGPVKTTRSFSVTDTSKSVGWSITSMSDTTPNEGTSATITYYTLNSTETLYWTINGTITDFSAINGSTTFSSIAVVGDNVRYIHTAVITIEADETTEGVEVFTFSLRTDNVSGTVRATQAFTVQDTSITLFVPSGQQAYLDPGTYSWVAPAGISTVSVVVIGAGGGGMNDDLYYGGTGGGGGGLAYLNNVPVTPGNTYKVVVGSGGIGVYNQYRGSDFNAGYGIVGNGGGDSVFYKDNTTSYPIAYAYGGHGGVTVGVNYHNNSGTNYLYKYGDGGAGGTAYIDLNNAPGASGTSYSGGTSMVPPTMTRPYDSYSGAIYWKGTTGGSAATYTSNGAAGVMWMGYGWQSAQLFPDQGKGIGISPFGVNGVYYPYPGAGGRGNKHSIEDAPEYAMGGSGAVRIIWGPDRAYPSTNTANV